MSHRIWPNFICSLFNNLKPASEIQTGSNYHVFKEGVEPKWEDEQNAKGGKWLITLPPKARVKQLDQMWLWAVRLHRSASGVLLAS
jgi:translation initiation factor 4E